MNPFTSNLRGSFPQEITLPSAGEKKPCSTHTWRHRNEQLVSNTIWFTSFRTVTTTSLTFSHLDVINPQWQTCTYRGQRWIIMTAQNDRCHGQGCQISALTLTHVQHFERTSCDWQAIIKSLSAMYHNCTISHFKPSCLNHKPIFVQMWIFLHLFELMKFSKQYIPCLGPAPNILLFSDEDWKLLLERRVFPLSLFNERMLQQMRHRWPRLKIFFQTPADVRGKKRPDERKDEARGVNMHLV